jgi:hypothetical protein
MYPSTLGNVAVGFVVGAQAILGVVSVGADKNITRARVVVAPTSVKISGYKTSLVVATINKNLG